MCENLLIQENLNAVQSHDIHTIHSCSLCVSAAHEVAVLISGSRWRASKWESQSGSMYVRNKRMTLAESQLCSSHKKHTLLWPFPSVCLFASLCHTHTPPCSYTFLYAVLQLETIYTPPQYHFIKKKKKKGAICKTLTEACRLLCSPYKQVIRHSVICSIYHSGMKYLLRGEDVVSYLISEEGSVNILLLLPKHSMKL